jgi:hypothetical protein
MSIELYLSQNRIADLEAQVLKLIGLINYSISLFPECGENNGQNTKKQLNKLLSDIVYNTRINYIPTTIQTVSSNTPNYQSTKTTYQPTNEIFNDDELVFSAINIISDEPMIIEELYNDTETSIVTDNDCSIQDCASVKCVVRECSGCIENQPNQQAHMDIGGCLYEEYEYSDDDDNDGSICSDKDISDDNVMGKSLLYAWHYQENEKMTNYMKSITKCSGCIENQPNQQAHMDIGGCLYKDYSDNEDEDKNKNKLKD